MFPQNRIAFRRPSSLLHVIDVITRLKRWQLTENLVYHFVNKNKAPGVHGNHLYARLKDTELAREECSFHAMQGEDKANEKDKKRTIQEKIESRGLARNCRNLFLKDR